MVVIVAIADDHVVRLLRMLEKLVARIELGVAFAAHRLYVLICLPLNPCVVDDLILVGVFILVDDHVDVLAKFPVALLLLLLDAWDLQLFVSFSPICSIIISTRLGSGFQVMPVSFQRIPC